MFLLQVYHIVLSVVQCIGNIENGSLDKGLVISFTLHIALSTGKRLWF